MRMRSAASAMKTAGVCVVRRGNKAGTTATVTDVHLPRSKAINDFSPFVIVQLESRHCQPEDQAMFVYPVSLTHAGQCSAAAVQGCTD